MIHALNDLVSKVIAGTIKKKKPKYASSITVQGI